MNDISTTSTSGMASGKIHTDLVRRTIRARTGIDRAEPVSAVPTSPAPTSSPVPAPAASALLQASVSDLAATACSWFLRVDKCSDGSKAPRQAADASPAERLACFWLYKRAS